MKTPHIFTDVRGKNSLKNNYQLYEKTNYLTANIIKTFYIYDKYNKNTLPISHRQVEQHN
jgi:hypothetical protein